ncbi:outer membrane protein assembly factor BamB family protein [Pseudothermotoga sp.]
MKHVLIALLLLSHLTFAATLFVVKEGIVELYDVSVPLIPVRSGSIDVSNAVKILSSDSHVYVLGTMRIEAFDRNLRPVRTVELNRKVVDAVLLEDLYVIHDYSISVFDKNLNLKASYTLNERLNKVSTYSKLLIALSDGKIIAFDRSLKRVWEISAQDPIISAQVVGSNLMFSTKKEFYIMNISEGAPILESRHKFALNFQQIVSVRNNLVALLDDKSILLLSRADLSVIDRLNISAASITSYKDYLYVVTDKGTIVIASVLPNSLKLFQTIATNVKWAGVTETDLLATTTTMSQVQTTTETRSVQEKPREDKFFTFLGEVKLAQKVNTTLAIGRELYMSTLDGNLLRVDPSTLKIQSTKVAFILTADPVVMDDGSIVLGSWDKSICVVTDKIVRMNTDSHVSLAVAKTPRGFVAVDDDGTLYIFDSKGSQGPIRVRLTGWFVCPPAVHEDYGILVLDWLGILHLVDFSGKEVWSSITESTKSAEIVVTDELAFVVTQKSIWCVQIKDGRTRWTQSFEKTGLLQAVSDGKTLYLCDSSGNVRALDFSGKTIWLRENLSARTILSTQAGPIAAGEKLYLLSAKDGSILLEEPLPVSISGKIKLAESGLLAMMAEDRILLYKLNSSPTAGWPMYLRDAVNSSLFRK